MSCALRELLCDNAAGDAVAGVAGRIGLVVVGFGVDYDGGAAVAEQRMRAVAEGYVVVLELRAGVAFLIDGEVLHVAGVVAIGIVESVLPGFGVEVRAGGFEVRGIALGVLMKVDGVLAWRKIVQVKLQGDAASLLPERDGADVFALGVFEVDFGFGGAGEGGHPENGGEGDEGKSKMFHAGNYSEFCPCKTTVAAMDDV